MKSQFESLKNTYYGGHAEEFIVLGHRFWPVLMLISNEPSPVNLIHQLDLDIPPLRFIKIQHLTELILAVITKAWAQFLPVLRTKKDNDARYLKQPWQSKENTPHIQIEIKTVLSKQLSFIATVKIYIMHQSDQPCHYLHEFLIICKYIEAYQMC